MKLNKTSKEDKTLIYPSLGSVGTRVKTANVEVVSSYKLGRGEWGGEVCRTEIVTDLMVVMENSRAVG